MSAWDALLELFEETGGARSLEELGRRAAVGLRRIVDGKGGSLLVDGEAGSATDPVTAELHAALVSRARPGGGNTTLFVADAAAEAGLEALGDRCGQEGVAALALMPLEAAGQLLGSLLVTFATPHPFDDDGRSVLGAAARHLALELRRLRRERDLTARLEAEVRLRRVAEAEVARRRRLEQHRELLIQAGTSLAESLDVGETLEALSRLVVPHFADWYVIHIVDESGGIVPAHIAHTDPDQVKVAWEAVTRWPTRPDAATPAALAIRAGQPSLMEHIEPKMLADAAQDAEHLRLLQDLRLESAVVVPLACPGKTIGAMTLISSQARRRYNFDDLAFVAALANRAALAIDNARLYRESTEAHERAETALEQLAMLARAGESIVSSLDPEEALTQLTRFLTSSLADYCIAYRLDDDETIHRVALSHADPVRQSLVEALIQAGPPRLEDPSGAGRVLRTGEPIFAADITPDVLARSVQNAQHLAILEQLEPISSIVVPLRARERTLGAIALATTRLSQRRYSEADLALCEEVARRAALLVDNARLYRDAVRATRARDEVLAVVSHDLRSPLQAIVTASELLIDAPATARARMAESILGAASRMNRLLEDLLDVTRIDEGLLSLHKQRFDLSAFIRDMVSVHSPVAEGRHVQLAAELDGQVDAIEADRDRLSQALSNIIDNALKFTPDGGEVRVAAGREAEAICISVSDSGPGIPQDQLPHLFDRFWRAEGSQRKKGVGLGLAISKGIAEAHGGRIEVTSQPGQGARFTIVLPAIEGAALRAAPHGSSPGAH